jgi:hypothetical protein
MIKLVSDKSQVSDSVLQAKHVDVVVTPVSIFLFVFVFVLKSLYGHSNFYAK